METQRRWAKVEIIAAPFFVAIISIHRHQLPHIFALASVFVGGIWFYLEKYCGDRFCIHYSFWKMQKNQSIIDEIKKTRRFSRTLLLMHMNIFIMVLLSLSQMIPDKYPLSACSAFGGLALLIFLFLDFYEHYIARN